MPTGALHSHYWAASVPSTPPQTGTAGRVSYTLWQTSIIGSGLGAFQVLYDRWRPAVRTTTQGVADGHD